MASTRCFTTESFYGLEVRVYRDISDVAAAEWDSVLGPDDLLMSHRFVQTCQQARIEDAAFWHLLISKNDETIGVATLHRMFVNLELLANGLTRKLVDQLKRRWPGFLRLPVLFCGLPVSCGQPCLKISAGAHFEHACTAVVEVMERVAATTSTQLLCFKEFDPDAIERMDFVLSRGYFRTFSLPSCSMSLTWDSFSSYLAAMRASYRRQVRSSLRARREAGLQVHHLKNVAFSETIFALYRQTVLGAQQRLETLNPEFFRLLPIRLGQQVEVILIELDGRPLAMALMLFSGNLATFLFAGMDKRRQPQWQLYQNLLVEVVAASIDAGASRLELGQTSYEIKSRLGAEESPRYLYLRYRGLLKHSLLRGFSSVLFPQYRYPQRHVFAR